MTTARDVINVNKASGFNLSVHGYSDVLKRLQLTKDQKGNLQKFLKGEAEKVVKTAKVLVHVVTGRLRDSHRVLTYGATGSGGVVRADIVAGGLVVRGKFVNYAAAHHAINPWLAMALQMHAPGFKDRLRSAIKIGRR